MGDKTKIDWCDSSWNPITGCLHGCEYCYARRMTHRYSGSEGYVSHDTIMPEYNCKRHTLDAPAWYNNGRKAPYPFDYEPTFHKYRLDIPARWTRPRSIFVCSMADLFGEWVPDEWIIEVLEACRRAPQHRYLFLTKNPRRYDWLEDVGIITCEDRNFWLGSTVTNVNEEMMHWSHTMHTFQSCEPMLAPWPPAGKPNEHFRGAWPEWVIFGAETGNRKGKVIPEKSWVDNAVQMCRNIGAAVFMKESLRGIMGEDFRQEFPWEV